MYLRYPTQCKALDVGDGMTNYSNFGDMPNVFLEWNQQDPVDQYETSRNDYIHVYQGNRNPFIDNPYLATVIWNGPIAENPWGPLGQANNIKSKEVLIYPNPVDDFLHLELENKNNEIFIEIYDLLSNHIITTKSLEVNMEKYNSGVYILKINQGENIKVMKVIKK